MRIQWPQFLEPGLEPRSVKEKKWSFGIHRSISLLGKASTMYTLITLFASVWVMHSKKFSPIRCPFVSARITATVLTECVCESAPRLELASAQTIVVCHSDCAGIQSTTYCISEICKLYPEAFGKISIARRTHSGQAQKHACSWAWSRTCLWYLMPLKHSSIR